MRWEVFHEGRLVTVQYTRCPVRSCAKPACALIEIIGGRECRGGEWGARECLSHCSRLPLVASEK